MADPNFFDNAGPHRLSEIAAKIGIDLPANIQQDLLIHDVAPLHHANEDQLSFLDNIKYKTDLGRTKAGCVLVREDLLPLVPSGTIGLACPSPYKAYALTAQFFYPYTPPAETCIAPHAHIDESAEIGDSCHIENGAVIYQGAKIGAQCVIGAGAVIGRNVQIGEGCVIGPNAVLSHCILGDHVTIYRGVAIGQDGFGFAIDPAGHVKVPQLGRVVIEDGVEIGANTCIDRGAGPDTVIGAGTWIDNLVQIGHNVKIGKGCVIVAHVGISGSTVLEDYVVLGGQVGVAGHLRIGKGARVAAQSGVMRDIPAGTEQMGSPAIPIKTNMRQIALLNRMLKENKK